VGRLQHQGDMDNGIFKQGGLIMWDSTSIVYINKEGELFVDFEGGCFQLVADAEEIDPSDFDELRNNDVVKEVFRTKDFEEFGGVLTTPSEYVRIGKLIAEDNGWTLEESFEQLECRDIFVKRDYVSDGPGWCGDLFIIIWGEPEFMTYIGKSTKEEWTIFKNGEI